MHNWVEPAVGTAIGAKTPRRVSTQGFWDAFGSCDKPDFILFSKSKVDLQQQRVRSPSKLLLPSPVTPPLSGRPIAIKSEGGLNHPFPLAASSFYAMFLDANAFLK